MKLLIFTQHFPPETVATGRRALDVAEAMAKRGHQVTVITGRPNHPSSLGRDFCQTAPRAEMSPAGYKILRVPVFRSKNTRTIHRLLTYATFALVAAWAGFRQEKPAVILAISPLPTGLAAMLVHWWRRVPMVFDLQDIWPDSAMAVGVMKRGLALRLLRRLERFFYGRCKLIVGISEGFRRYLLDLGVKPERVAVIPNGVDWEMFADMRRDRELERTREVDRRFLVGYVGNIGLAQGLETVLDAAERLRHEPIEFLLVGEGVDKGRLQKLSRAGGLEKVHFCSGVPHERVASILAACDALLLVLRNDPLFDITIPSKLYEYMAAGKPVVCSVGGEAASVVATCGCGLPVSPSDGVALAEVIQKLCRNPSLCRTMGDMGRRAARGLYSRDDLMANYAELAEVLASRVGRPFMLFELPVIRSLSSRKS